MKKKDIESLLQKMISGAEELFQSSRESPKFRVWEDTVYRRIIKIYGEDSREFYGFKGINFHLDLGRMFSKKEDYIKSEKQHFQNCLEEAILFFNSLIEDLELLPQANTEEADISTVTKIFISHSSRDKKIVSELVQLLSLIGISDSSIFCTSLEGHGIPLGEDWLKTLKNEISGEAVVLFVISENYFKSAVSLCEMGAAWVLSKKHIPILIPPMDYNQMSGVIPLTQGFKINEKEKWTLLKSQLETLFNLTPKAPVIWEDRRNQILERVQKILDN